VLQKKQRPRSSNSKKETKVKVTLQVTALQKILLYFFSDNPNASRMTLTNLTKFFSMIDESCYTDVGDSIEDYVYLIKFLLENYLNKNLRNEVLLESISAEIIDHDELIALFPTDEEGMLTALSDEDIAYVDGWVSDRLVYAHTFTANQMFRDFSEKFNGGDYRTLKDANSHLKEMIQNLNHEINNAELIVSANKLDFDFGKDSLTSAYDTTIKGLNHPTNYIKTGLKSMNKMLGGGFNSSRVYLVLGKTGGWKSGFLLSGAIWAKMFNDEVIPRDVTKRPCALYVSHENDQEETMVRLYDMLVPEDEQDGDIRDLSPEEVYEKFEDQGIDMENGLNVRIIYRPNKSWNTADLDSYIDQLSSEGLEIIIVFHDYIKRINPVNFTGDLRIDIAEVGNEFSTSSKKRKIPIVTGMQINREGMRKLREASIQGQKGLGVQMGDYMIGESQILLENVDACFFNYIENLEEDGVEVKYLTTTLFKYRGKRPDNSLDWFAHPFESVDSMRLMTDENTDEYLAIEDVRQFASGNEEENESTTSSRIRAPSNGGKASGSGKPPARRKLKQDIPNAKPSAIRRSGEIQDSIDKIDLCAEDD